ncbi:MAG: hypothetical protein HRU34_09995 [Richelia sp.]|nr:hypothetical protein [Richelia sp.]
MDFPVKQLLKASCLHLRSVLSSGKVPPWYVWCESLPGFGGVAPVFFARVKEQVKQ